jgi:hypothetical protein
MDDRGSIPGRGSDGILSLRQRVKTGFGTHPASYAMGTGDKAAGDWSWQLTSIYCRGYEYVELYIHPQYAFMSRGA